MKFLYSFSIYTYGLLIRMASLWNPKAKLWVKGRKNWSKKLNKNTKGLTRIHWFHCASLGEFEQARPLIEKLKLEQIDISILITFFSPSGYEIKKEYELADYVCYLPLDTSKNAKLFISNVKIEKAYFVKYEVWPNFFKQLHRKSIPFYLISATFRENQIYFKPLGKWFKKLLSIPTHIFVQNEASKILLQKHGINSINSGDTRYDNVNKNAQQAIPIPIIEQFKNNNLLMIAGSSWQPEEKILGEFLNTHKTKLKTIIAPHDINQAHLNNLDTILGTKIKTIKYSEITKETEIKNYDILIIDNIGILSNLYQYGDIAFIGGGFSNEIHNILEPATFGIPVIYGNNHAKFPEAKEMVENGGGIEIKNYTEFEKQLLFIIQNPFKLADKAKKNKQFIDERIGATELVYNSVIKN